MTLSFRPKIRKRREALQIRPGDIIVTESDVQYLVISVEVPEQRIWVFNISFTVPDVLITYRDFIIRNFDFLMSSPTRTALGDVIIQDKKSFHWNEWSLAYTNFRYYERSMHYVKSLLKANPSVGLPNKSFSAMLQKDVD